MASRVTAFLLLVFFLLPASSTSSISFGRSGLNFSSSAPHIFASAYGLLQQWPNTFFPYGHSIVPCEVPVNTPLYHARIDGDLPTSPEWFAFDPEMSYAIAGLLETSRLLTYKTTKKVKCIYFNGASASLSETGNMDTQMVFIHNNSAAVPDKPLIGPPAKGPSNNRTSGDPNGAFLGAEYDRAEALCSFIKDKGLGGRGWGYEGIVRMNAAFEIIWCDFDSPSVRLVSHLNVSNPSLVSDERKSMMAGVEPQNSQHAILAAPPGSRRRERTFLEGSQLGWLTATANRYGLNGNMAGRGEARLRPDSCGIFSFYDTNLGDQEHARVLKERNILNISSSGSWTGPTNTSERDEALQQLTRRRRSHRATNVSIADGMYMRTAVETRLRNFLKPGSSACSDTDWHQITQNIVLAYSANLHDFHELLLERPGDEDLRKWLKPRRELAHMTVMPYYEYPAEAEIKRSPSKAFSTDSKQATDALERCREQSSPEWIDQLGESETLIHTATRNVLGSICGTTLKAFLSIEELWSAAVLSKVESATSYVSKVEKTRTELLQDVEELMAWLGWADQWTSCKPGCGLGQICYIPIWPLMNLGVPGLESSDGENGPSEGGPPSGLGYGGPRRPGYGGPGGPGFYPGYGYPGYGHRGPPPRWGQNDKLLWEPRCVNRTQILG